ncbi:hypothetical protein SCP_0604320 [Sparassis crispa]|uniref:Uncharacterized protein n=1 Tax=Sparassis crispa TaxID=139825 RepID=A0A401GQF3_9APHY|nr:hypothetical protein SCP_0604320 [Sparassis crispa]GBE84453.1 hypothetical protein SCP_0604320 [Sparassis crispa]
MFGDSHTSNHAGTSDECSESINYCDIVAPCILFQSCHPTDLISFDLQDQATVRVAYPCENGHPVLPQHFKMWYQDRRTHFPVYCFCTLVEGAAIRARCVEVRKPDSDLCGQYILTCGYQPNRCGYFVIPKKAYDTVFYRASIAAPSAPLWPETPVPPSPALYMPPPPPYIASTSSMPQTPPAQALTLASVQSPPSDSQAFDDFLRENFPPLSPPSPENPHRLPLSLPPLPTLASRPTRGIGKGKALERTCSLRAGSSSLEECDRYPRPMSSDRPERQVSLPDISPDITVISVVSSGSSLPPSPPSSSPLGSSPPALPSSLASVAMLPPPPPSPVSAPINSQSGSPVVDDIFATLNFVDEIEHRADTNREFSLPDVHDALQAMFNNVPPLLGPQHSAQDELLRRFDSDKGLTWAEMPEIAAACNRCSRWFSKRAYALHVASGQCN